MVKAAVVAAPGQLEIHDLPQPELGDYQVLCRQLYGSVCAATDRHLIRGDLPLPNIGYPLILGHESIGRVVEVGPKVKNFQPGDLITRTGYPENAEYKAFWGGFVEFAVATDGRAMEADGLPEEEWTPHLINQRLPGDVDPAAATMMITWRETYSYLSRLGVEEDAAVLILGSGGNGFSFAVLARALGAGRVVMLGNPHWRELASRAGVDELIDYRDEDAAAAVANAAPDGFHLIIDAVGKTGGLEPMVPLLRAGGRIGIYGIEDLGERMGYLASLKEEGVDVHGPGEYAEAEAHDAVTELLRSGALDAGIWFDLADPVPLADIGRAIEQIEARRSIKALVALNPD